MKRFNEHDSIDPIVSNPVSNPLINNLGKTEQNIGLDISKAIIDEKLKLKNTGVMQMVSTLTNVQYYHIKPDSVNKNYIIDTNPLSDISENTKKYQYIKDFKVKFLSAMNMDNEIDENVKSYVTSGSILILPRTIKPYENDMFQMEYMGNILTYIINTVELKTYEKDSAFECSFTLYKEDFVINEDLIEEHFEYHNELIGTTYRPILTSLDHNNLQKIRKLYDTLGTIFRQCFYDPRVNSFFLEGYDEKYILDQSIKTSNNINICDNTGPKVNSSEFWKNTPLDTILTDELCGVNTCKFEENIFYDNFLNKFIRENDIFQNVSNRLILPDILLPFDKKTYFYTIFNVIKTKSVAGYKNNLLSAVNVDYSSPGVSGYFYGKKNVLHLNGTVTQKSDILNTDLIYNLQHLKTYDTSLTFDKLTYKNVTALIVDTIVRYILNENGDFIDRFLFMFDNQDNLYENVVKTNDIYYLYPILGYIIENTLVDYFKDNVLLN